MIPIKCLGKLQQGNNMKILTQFFVLLIVTTLISCTEEISEEIQNEASANKTTSDSDSGDSSLASETASIRVINNQDPQLSFIMHKAGSVEEACELDAPAGGFDAADYANNDPDTVIDCILDAEEYDLYFEGMDIDIQVDANLCEYVQYKPFKYFQWQPGYTNRSLYKVECDQVCTDANPAICDKSFATDTAGVLSNELTNTDSDVLCSFDYSDETTLDESEIGPNCDTGSFYTKTYTYTSYDHDDDPLTDNICPAVPESSEFIESECGGDLKACYGGGSFPTELPLDKTSLVTQNTSLDSLTIDAKVESPFSQGFATNLSIANFSRVCSSTTNTKVDSDFDVGLVDLIGDEVETMTSASSFSPIPVDIEEDGNIDHYILAKNPLDGIAISSSARSDLTPYYQIRCLDSARDIKAQIRIFVREWDRTFDDDNLFIARLSDVNQGLSARMDSNGDQEPGRSWNNFLDWDDHFTDLDLDDTTDTNNFDGYALLDPVFENNQCVDLNTGYCYDSNADAADPAQQFQSACEAASVDHYWIPGRQSFPEFRK